MLTLKKLDKRMNGHTRFTHKACFEGHSAKAYPAYVQSRNYLWSQFGPSCELDAINFIDPNAELEWAWQCDDHVTVIFLKGKALTQYMLVMDKYAQV